MAKDVQKLISVRPQYQVNRGAVKAESGLAVKYTACAIFDPSADTTKRPIGSYGLGVYIPTKAIITKVWYDVITTVASAGADAGTLALTIQSAGDAVAAIAISDSSNPWDAGLHGTLIGSPNLGADAAHDSALEVAALFAGSMLKTTAEREITIAVAEQALTAGKIAVFAEYLISA